jgi:mRNA interferase HigB
VVRTRKSGKVWKEGARKWRGEVGKISDAKTSIEMWLAVAKSAEWLSLGDVREDFPSADMIGPVAIFNIRTGHYRLIARFVFAKQRIYIKEFLTHAEYNRNRWKKWL